jgi:DNA-binding CsgD family transcriptional regulator
MTTEAPSLNEVRDDWRAGDSASSLRAAPKILIFDRDLHLVSHVESDPDYVETVRESVRRFTSGDAQEFELREDGSLLRVLPLHGRLSGYAVLIEGARERDSVQKCARRYRLSARETEILRMLVQGLARQEIAARLGIGRTTVQSHVQKIGFKVGCTRRDEIVARALGMS